MSRGSRMSPSKPLRDDRRSSSSAVRPLESRPGDATPPAPASFVRHRPPEQPAAPVTSTGTVDPESLLHVHVTHGGLPDSHRARR